MSLAKRFWSKVDIRQYDECWLWTGGRTGEYGVLQRHKKEGKRGCTANKICWELCFGVVQEGMDVGHRCANKLCVNPAHLYLTTRKENMREMSSRRYGKGDYVFPSPIQKEVLSGIREWALSEKNGTPTTKNFHIPEIMICGHFSSYIVSSNEGTSFCVLCAYLDEHDRYKRIGMVINE